MLMLWEWNLAAAIETAKLEAAARLRMSSSRNQACVIKVSRSSQKRRSKQIKSLVQEGSQMNQLTPTTTTAASAGRSSSDSRELKFVGDDTMYG